MHNGRPLPARKQVQFLVALTLLAWATQTLMAQWSRGAEAVPASEPAVDASAKSAFVPREARAGAVLELRGEATVFGGDVKLKQVCRWPSRDAAMFAPVADLVIARLGSRRPFRVLDVSEIRQTLADAGINVSLVRFSGPVECTVSRSDVELDEGEALEQWIQAHKGGNATGDLAGSKETPAGQGDAGAEPQPAALRLPARATAVAAMRQNDTLPSEAGDEDSGIQTLRTLLLADVSARLGLSIEQLQLTFDPRDDSALNLAEPAFKFNLQPRQVRDLGDVSWDVAIVSGSGSRKVQIRATARAWQQQLLVTRPLARGQVIQASDVTAKRALVDRLPDGALLTAEQVVGQITARELKAGTLVTAPLVQALPLAKLGQFVTITLNRGSVRIKTVGKAMEAGSFGQTIRVKNEATRDVYQVVLTGPQEATMAAPDAPVADTKGVASVGTD